MLSVAARHFEAEPSLYGSLCGPVMRLVWRAVSDVPQNYHVVKALALLCSWPFPTSSTTTDPTLVLSGIMMQIALQIGLHRPSHAQDFTKFKIELREADLKDRVRTWAICNIVAQRYVVTLVAVIVSLTEACSKSVDDVRTTCKYALRLDTGGQKGCR